MIKLNLLPTFPSKVTPGAGIGILKASGNYTVSLDYSEFAPPSPSLPVGSNVLVYDPVTDAYTLVPTALASADKVSKAGDTMTGTLSVPAFNAYGIAALFGTANYIGPGGTGTTAGVLIRYGSSGVGGGAFTSWQKNGVPKWYDGFHNSILGGSSDDYLLYSVGLGGSAIQVSYATGAVALGATTASTSPTTGALTVAGGVGVADSLFVGNVIGIGSRYFATYAGGYQFVYDPEGNVALLFGSATTSSAINIYRNSTHIFQTIGGAVAQATITSAQTAIHPTTASTSTNTGALVVAGGVGVAGSLWAGIIATTPVAVASLPAAAAGLKGSRAFVTDANATTFAAIVAGGGANNIPVYCDGTNWRIG